MANLIGYEELTVTTVPVQPSTALVAGGAACAVFLVDPSAEGGVRWRPRQGPTAAIGLPLLPGKWISVAGDGNIRNSFFVLDGSARSTAVRVHAMYFDRVDVVAAEFAPSSAPEQDRKTLEAIEKLGRGQEAILRELKITTEHLRVLSDLDGEDEQSLVEVNHHE